MKHLWISALFSCLFTSSLHAQQWYEMQHDVQSRVSSFENMNGTRGSGGQTNKGAKGNAFQWLYPGDSVELLNIKEQGIIQRIWLTVNQSPRLLRSLRLQMFWDGAGKAAVDVPLGDFFVSNLGRTVPFQSALFSSPEGRSFNCFIPMPFKKGARITLFNQSPEDTAKLFYDVDFVLVKQLPPGAMYFHAFWNRQLHCALGDDFIVLPRVRGSGRFMGMSVGLNTDSAYDNTWWGEGEVKMYLDGDSLLPTINGTGAEDYVGTGWGMGAFNHWYQGAPVADEKSRQFVFYRWHLPDAVWFHKNIQVTLQQIGGAPKGILQQKEKEGTRLQPVTVDNVQGFVRLLDMPVAPGLSDARFPEGWVNFYRTDDFSAVAYFYLDQPVSALPSLPGPGVRLQHVR